MEFNDRRGPRVQQRVRGSQIHAGDHYTGMGGSRPIMHVTTGVAHTPTGDKPGVNLHFADGGHMSVTRTSRHNIAHMPSE